MLSLVASVLASDQAARPLTQVLVLGPHHSGTSLTARALGKMGLFLGAPDDLLLDGTNPNKFWERRDVVEANQHRLHEGTRGKPFESAHLPAFVGYGFDPSVGSPLSDEVASVRDALAKLSASGKAWATKDPRLSLVAAEWLQLLDQHGAGASATACVLTVRHPLDFANSMLAYAPEIGLAGWSGIWLHYMAQALTACAGRPMALVDHDELTRHTPRALAALRNRLSSLGVPLTTPPAVAAERGTAEGAGSDGRERTASHESDGTASALSAELGLGAPPPRAQ